MPTILEWCNQKLFSWVHNHNLIYNTCWEDPRLDRQALSIRPDHELLMITSAGCNALDYALDNPRHIYAIDMNPRQNALLDLKIAGIRALDFETFFQLFGMGRCDDFKALYARDLRPQLGDASRQVWDKRLKAFEPTRMAPTFYFRGTSGLFARLANAYVDVRRLRDHIEPLFEIDNPEERQQIYTDEIERRLWNGWVRRALRWDGTLSLLGVPRPQRQQLESTYAGGIVQFMEECLEAVFLRLPIRDNYFWRVYLFGSYTPDCCPEYLKPHNFERLKDGLVDNVSTHTCTITDFLQSHRGQINRYVLLDHMDWLSTFGKPLLQAEWQALLDHASPDARFLWRSGGLHTDFVDAVEVRRHGEVTRVGELLRYQRERAAALHSQDRVHTYGSFYIADLATA